MTIYKYINTVQMIGRIGPSGLTSTHCWCGTEITFLNSMSKVMYLESDQY